jgi:hypothetical protein
MSMVSRIVLIGTLLSFSPEVKFKDAGRGNDIRVSKPLRFRLVHRAIDVTVFTS